MPDVNVSPVGALDDEQVQQAAVKRIKRLPGWFDIGEADALAWREPGSTSIKQPPQEASEQQSAQEGQGRVDEPR